MRRLAVVNGVFMVAMAGGYAALTRLPALRAPLRFRMRRVMSPVAAAVLGLAVAQPLLTFVDAAADTVVRRARDLMVTRKKGVGVASCRMRSRNGMPLVGPYCTCV